MANTQTFIRAFRTVNLPMINRQLTNLLIKNLRCSFVRFYTENESPVNAETNTDEAEAEKDFKKLLGDKEILLQTAKKDLADFKDKYIRSLAECENVRRRGVKMVTDAKLFAIQSFSKDLLEVADILEKATKSVPEIELSKNEHLKNLFDGMTMTETQLQKVFSKHGLEKVDPIDEKFDPNFHEALFQQQISGKDAGIVFMVNKTGYILNGRPVRAALVGVTK